MTRVAVVGATATGKSALAVDLALALDGEVVNADAMQLYRGMDIGTAKATAEERRGVPHHVLDVWDVTEAASVADYQRRAHEAVAAVEERGRVAVLVGGSGLYVRAAVDALVFPGTDAEVRRQVEADLARRGAPALHARLAEIDPAAAAAILPSNGRRLVRALEVIALTGRPFTATLPTYEERPDWVQLGLEIPLPTLDARIAERVDRMWQRGLVDEVRALVPQGLRTGPTAGRALGYAQVLDHLDGVSTSDEARERTVAATRRFARRQRSWFRRDPRVQWLDAAHPDLVGAALATVAAAGKAAG